MDTSLFSLRHALATLGYRAAKVFRGVDPGFGGFRAADGVRTPCEIAAHMGDLMDWAAGLAEGRHEWKPVPSQGWEADARRFFEGLAALDRQVASAPAGLPVERLFQGPVADALTHVGQIALLRRMAAVPIKGENYFKADIQAGRAGTEQADPRYEF